MGTPSGSRLSTISLAEQHEIEIAVALTGREWLFVVITATLVLAGVPRYWFATAPLDQVPDYRVPYRVSRDYALYRAHLSAIRELSDVYVVGDSVVWGEYVRQDGTLSHFLSEQDSTRRYTNAGLNGLFPLALEGLVRCYGQPISNSKVILHCNLLWMSSVEADLSSGKEQVFNHVDLVPQWNPWIPCYRADITTRVSRIVRRRLPHLSWARHIQHVDFGGSSLPEWTLQDDGKYPASYPNSHEIPFLQISRSIPSEPVGDNDRGVGSPRHVAWTDSGRNAQSFSWVPTDESLQWAAFQRLTKLLHGRGNDVFVVVGPFNKHIVSPSNQGELKRVQNAVTGWLETNDIAFVVPEALPSELYGDASHPLTAGYELLAQRLLDDSGFQAWLTD